jgi:molecular chaperone GrpE
MKDDRKKDDPERFELSLDEEPSAVPPEEAQGQVQAAVGGAETGAVGETADQAAARQLAKLQAEKEDLLNTLIRRQADFENYKKRMERERAENRDRAHFILIESLLPILDGFERALDAAEDPSYEDYRKGFELIYRQLFDALARYGLEPIEALGKPFDPHLHHAIERVESAEHDDGTIVEEHQRGYMLRGKVLRPAMVRVAVKPHSRAGEREPED